MASRATQRGRRDACGGFLCRMPIRLLAVAAVTVLTACASQPLAVGNQQHEPIKPYPITRGIKATVVGTPPAYRADLPDAVPIDVRALPPLVKRPVPPVLDYAVPLQYAVAAQPGPAPLVFIIAGTGAAADSGRCRQIMRILYAVEYHTVCLPSPTSVDFMVGAARHPVPGYMPADVAALYSMMRAVRRELAGALAVTGYALTGYSLGATQAAFVARHDERLQAFGFERVLLINPAVSLWDSVRRMDALLANNLPGGIAGVPGFLAALLADIRDPYAGSRPIAFNRAFLFRALLAREAEPRELAAVVGLVFRLALANMAFAADVLTTSGVIVPVDVQLSGLAPLESYMVASFRLSFAEYIDRLLLPYWNRGARYVTREQLIQSANLHTIQDYLAANEDIAVITNKDDPILDEHALAFLRETFGQRAYIFPNGGHLGNLRYRKVVRTIQRFFAP